MTINVLYQNRPLSNQQAQGVNQTFTINTATVVDGNTVYRKVLFLRLPADAQAAQLVLKQFQLAAIFSAVTFNAGAGSSLLKPQGWRQKDGKTLLRFARAWPISRINSNSHNGFALYRVDGDAIADEATVVGVTNHDLGPDFVSHEFAVELTNISVLENEIVLAQQGFSTRAMVKSASPISAMESAVSVVGSVFDNTAVVNIVGLRSVGIFGMPSTPRIGVLQDAVIDADIEAGNYAAGKIDWLSLTPGEHPVSINATIGADVLPRIQSIIDSKLAAGVQDHTVILSFVFESDAPCQCALSQLQIVHALRTTLFGDAQPEVKLRFSGAAIERQQIPFKLPAGIIETVSMEINDAAQDQLAVGVAFDATQHKAGTAAAINPQQAVAVRVTIPAAMIVRGVSLALTALTAAVGVELSLHEDRNGSPAGAILATAACVLDRIGTRQFVNLLFDAPATELLLDQKPYWLVLGASAGSFLWLSAATAPAQKVLLLKDLPSAGANRGAAQTQRAVSGIALEYGWIANRGGALSAAIDVAFSVGAQPVPLQADSANTRRHALLLPSPITNSAIETSLSLTATRTSAGVVSLSALHIDYLPHP